MGIFKKMKMKLEKRMTKVRISNRKCLIQVIERKYIVCRNELVKQQLLQNNKTTASRGYFTGRKTGVRKEKGPPHSDGVVLSSQNKERKRLSECSSKKKMKDSITLSCCLWIINRASGTCSRVGPAGSHGASDL